MNDTAEAQYVDDIRAALGLLVEGNALAALEKADVVAREHPDRAEGYYVLGLAAVQLEDVGRATSLIQRAHDIDPDRQEYADALAIIHTRVGKLTEGLYFAKLATALEPHPEIENFMPVDLGTYVQALVNVTPSIHHLNAEIAYNRRSFREGADLCGMELRVNPDNVNCHVLLGRFLYELAEYDRAVAAHHSAAHLEPDNAANGTYLGNSLYRLGRQDEAEACHALAMSKDPFSIDAVAAAIQGLSLRGDVHWQGRDTLEEELGRRIEVLPELVGLEETFETPDPGVGDKIRLGYLGNRFHAGGDMSFFEALIKAHDRDRFETYCYQQSIVQDPVTTDLRVHVDGWREIYDLDDDVVASIVEGDGIHALVDLCGYTEGNRIAVFAFKSAPLRIGWVNHLDGTGRSSIDVILSDPITRDVDEAGAGPGQTCMVLECGLFSLSPPAMFPAVGELSAKRIRRLTFGGISDLARIDPGVAEAWSRILLALPGSRLLLGGVPFVCEAVKDQCIDLFAHFGTAGRVSFHEPEVEGLADAEYYNAIDVMLDTFPVNGTIETCHALWMGVPVLTLKGDRRTARYGASILTSAGRPEWIAETVDGLTHLAKSFAADIEQLARVRAGLRDSLIDTALFRPEILARSLEAAVGLALEERRKPKKKAKAKKAKAKKAAK